MSDSTLVLSSDEPKVATLPPLTAPAVTEQHKNELITSYSSVYIPVFDQPIWFLLQETTFSVVSDEKDSMIE